MRWIVRLDLVRDDGVVQSRELGSISRPTTDLRPEDVGLSLAEGRLLVADIERTMIADQTHIYTLACRRCPGCGKLQHFKDVRTKCVQTVHGAYRLRGRRIRSCPCQVQQGYSPAFFPIAEIIPRRTTPEARYLFAELGARMPYREVSTVLNTCGLGRMRAGRMAIWRHTVELGKLIHEQQCAAGAGNVSIGIDDTYARCQGSTSRKFKITGGRLERDGELAERFAFVSSSPAWSPQQFRGALLEHGIDSDTRVHVIGDGDDGLRHFVQNTVSAKVTQQLDWFHVGMRLERLRKATHLPVSYAEYVRQIEAAVPLERRVASLRDALWIGRPWRGLLQLARLQRDARRWPYGRSDQLRDALERLDCEIEEFRGYISGNRRSVPNFAKACAQRERISTAHVESVMNHLVNHRMSKRQQMRWSPGGAHYLLQVRT